MSFSVEGPTLCSRHCKNRAPPSLAVAERQVLELNHSLQWLHSSQTAKGLSGLGDTGVAAPCSAVPSSSTSLPPRNQGSGRQSSMKDTAWHSICTVAHEPFNQAAWAGRQWELERRPPSCPHRPLRPLRPSMCDMFTASADCTQQIPTTKDWDARGKASSSFKLPESSASMSSALMPLAMTKASKFPALAVADTRYQWNRSKPTIARCVECRFNPFCLLAAGLRCKPVTCPMRRGF